MQAKSRDETRAWEKCLDGKHEATGNSHLENFVHVSGEFRAVLVARQGIGASTAQARAHRPGKGGDHRDGAKWGLGERNPATTGLAPPFCGISGFSERTAEIELKLLRHPAEVECMPVREFGHAGADPSPVRRP